MSSGFLDSAHRPILQSPTKSRNTYSTKFLTLRKYYYRRQLLVSGLLILVVLLVQILRTSTPSGTFPNKPSYPSLLGNDICPVQVHSDPFGRGEQYNPSPVFSESPNSRAPANMGLAEEAKRIAAQFDYPMDEAQKGVREFIRQMDEGLEKQGAVLSQIPSYVTAVPDGTEKVALRHRHQ
jgi:hexokinase